MVLVGLGLFWSVLSRKDEPDSRHVQTTVQGPAIGSAITFQKEPGK
jgi:hypothetical protein